MFYICNLSYVTVFRVQNLGDAMQEKHSKICGLMDGCTENCFYTKNWSYLENDER